MKKRGQEGKKKKEGGERKRENLLKVQLNFFLEKVEIIFFFLDREGERKNKREWRKHEKEREIVRKSNS